VIGIALLVRSIPLSIWGVMTGVNQLVDEELSGGVSAYYGIIGVVVGFVMTAVGAVRVLKR
jgi:hypothetical protein